MGKSCCVISCTSKYEKGNGLHFYHIPKEPDDRRKLWIAAIKSVGTNGQQWEPKDHYLVCSRHFIKGTKSNDPENPDYVPSINMGYSCENSTNRELRHATSSLNVSNIENQPQQEMANDNKKGQSRLNELGIGTTKDAKLDSSVNQSDSPEAISSNEDDPESIPAILKSKLSIFKLANNRLAGLKENQDDIKKFGQCINKVLIKKGTRCENGMADKYAPFHVMHFFHSTSQTENATAVQISKELNDQKVTKQFLGDVRSGNILVFYRLKQNRLGTQNSIPEAFFLCQGLSYHHILCLCDPSFRTRIAKRFMDGEKIKQIETLNIAGSDVTSTNTYKDNCNIAEVSLLERAIVKLSGIIVRDSELDKLIQRDGSQEILMEAGVNFVRICKSLSLVEWPKVLELFSDTVDDKVTEVNRPTCHIRDALEYVRRVEEDEKSRDLDHTITEKAIDIIANNQPTFSYYLSNRYIRDWTLSSNVVLSQKHTSSKSCEEITSWYSAPTLIMVIEAIKRHFKTPTEIRKCIKECNIVLSFGRESGMKNIPVQNFVHGSVSSDEGGQYFKIAQKWFSLSSTYSQVVDRNFTYLFHRILLDERISDLMKYPWRPHKLEITISDCPKILGVSPDTGQKILQKLTEECELVDELNNCCLTVHSYLLPQSSKLYKELAKKEKGNNTKEKKGKNTKEKKGKNTKTSGNTMEATMNKLSGNNMPNQNSGNGPAGSMDSSAPVRSISDTASSSLDMSRPSGSGWNPSGGGNNIDQNQTNTSEENSDKKNGVGKMLYQVLTADGKKINDSGVLSVLQKTKGEICVQEDNKYFVCNPILTEEMMEQIKDIDPSLEEPILSNFLRCMSPLSEGDYNALYLNCEEDNNFIIFPGDKVLANKVELFDILVYDKENHTTYLFHNKEGLNYHTRDACAQIRNASELLWHDFERGQRNHIQLFWENAVNPKKAETPYRYFLKRKLTELGKDKFMEMFNEDAKIVFVLAFVIFQSKASSKLHLKFKPSKSNDVQKYLHEDEKTLLETEGILTKSGYLTDCFIGMTQKQFAEKFKSSDMEIPKLNKIHTLLRTKGTCELSTIAKLELLTLNNCFSRYQIGGERHYHLKLLQLNSK